MHININISINININKNYQAISFQLIYYCQLLRFITNFNSNSNFTIYHWHRHWP